MEFLLHLESRMLENPLTLFLNYLAGVTQKRNCSGHSPLGKKTSEAKLQRGEGQQKKGNIFPICGYSHVWLQVPLLPHRVQVKTTALLANRVNTSKTQTGISKPVMINFHPWKTFRTEVILPSWLMTKT